LISDLENHFGANAYRKWSNGRLLDTGNFLDGSVKGKDGLTYERWGAFTLGAEHSPDSPNHANFPSTELKPGETYSQTNDL
jgi:galactose mutarotase-like enzyme